MHRWIALLGVLGCGRSPADLTDLAPTPIDVPTPPTPIPPPTPEPIDVGPTRLIPDEAFLPAALAALDAAEQEIRVAQYLIYDGGAVNGLLGALTDAADRGVRVRVLADQEGSETGGILERLTLDGIEVAFDSPATTLHAKLIVADGVALVGSHNWSHAAMASNHEGSALIADPEVAAWYGRWFDSLWEAPNVDPDPGPPPPGSIRPIADLQVTGALTDCLDQAGSEVDLVLYALAWDANYPGSEVDQVLTALESAHARGVDVRVTLDASSWIVSNDINDAAIARLEAAGLTIDRTPGSVTTHAKVLRCDDRVVVSDANWSYSGLVLMHGTSVVFDDPELAASAAGWAEAVRSE